MEGDTYVINGVKHFATNGSGWERKGAHLYTLTTRTDLSRGAKDAFSIIAIPGDTSGIRIGKIENKIGHRLTVQPEVIFEDVRVPRGTASPSSPGLSAGPPHSLVQPASA